MKTLELNELENVNGGDFVGGFCAGVATVGGGYAIGGNLAAITAGAVSNLWNPVGWVLGAAAIVAVGCAANYIANN